MLPSVTFLDLETTGATPLRDRITEIALVRFDHGIETVRWQTLVNPQQPIPPFIQSLTGISDAMVADAPLFSEVADKLLALLEGSVLAAHNVRFDHGFLKSEFKRLGITLRQKVLCTVKLSRLLYPQFYSHGIDAIVSRHQITGLARHRAMGDVEAILVMLNDAKRDLGEAAVQAAAMKLMAAPTLPPHIDASMVGELPEAPGVYLFYGENDLPLYVGKSVNIRARVLSHFSSDHASTKEMRMTQEMKRFEWIPTAGEFSALLLESRLVKERQPIYNRQLRRERSLCSWQIDPLAQPQVKLVHEDEIDPSQMTQLFGTFRSKRQAIEALRKIADLSHLCVKKLGLEAGGRGPCFAYQLKRCKGVCCGQEPPEIHALRVQQALMAHKLKSWPYRGKIGIEEYSLENDVRQMHVFEHWVYLGVAEDDDRLQDLRTQKTALKFDLDSYKLLLKMLAHKKTRVHDLAD
ncbi:exonuclease domain-containing protein [Methylophilus medardicus]|uniref:Excinuclease cho n=1 Tax=Methylophilus medardicus TaxID=2588534 RepID=A0A5B8CQJ3_9PROT|nr:exonuclease domain-containing protein [Methylophilus medardicus]QDC43523.1 DNA polymerase III subunit epsilon [Methylophilus medardicus]QDC48530.1 DNA polymerase III subunit epsilon [Methylophilus medardicus]QDC52235.1 DNA polymerase III subunit epsilon [Methylophilus medardicus]